MESTIANAAQRASLSSPTKNACVVVRNGQGEREKTFVIVGVERGGTSMVAGVVRALGIDLGRRAGLNHEDPRFVTDDETRLTELIEQRNGESAVWGFKMPKAAMKLDFFARHLRNPYFVFVYRNPVAVADSWYQRGAADHPGALQRCMAYYEAMSRFLEQSDRPAVLVNYERATQAPHDMVRDLARFAELDVTDATAERAAAMVTGDGLGYVNLPEHHFRVVPTNRWPEEVGDGARVSLTSNAETVCDADGWVEFDRLATKLIYERADGENLPPYFVLELDVDDGGQLNLHHNPIRVYFDFIGELFPGHCARPALKRGRNLLLVETSGLATRLALGPLEAGSTLKLSARIWTDPAGAHRDIWRHPQGTGTGRPRPRWRAALSELRRRLA